ncbi:MAG: 2Fe-2S iron-sulfur cluster-binding protein, partial [Alphaproteobacteria bacterium]|nr:2Fe-2S iron-sulfur cluster-binding protein [Alphaproteobacteria bacterium]
LIVMEDQDMHRTWVLLEGWAFRYKSFEDGRRQVLNYMLPGDIIGLYSVMLRSSDYEVEAICGGQCSCATCHVYVGDDWTAQVGGPSDEERELLEELDSFKDTSRLSCQIEFSDALDGLTVEIAPEE